MRRSRRTPPPRSPRRAPSASGRAWATRRAPRGGSNQRPHRRPRHRRGSPAWVRPTRWRPPWSPSPHRRPCPSPAARTRVHGGRRPPSPPGHRAPVPTCEPPRTSPPHRSRRRRRGRPTPPRTGPGRRPGLRRGRGRPCTAAGWRGSRAPPDAGLLGAAPDRRPTMGSTGTLLPCVASRSPAGPPRCVGSTPRASTWTPGARHPDDAGTSAGTGRFGFAAHMGVRRRRMVD